jgi:hypothetical protein
MCAPRYQPGTGRSNMPQAHRALRHVNLRWPRTACRRPCSFAQETSPRVSLAPTRRAISRPWTNEMSLGILRMPQRVLFLGVGLEEPVVRFELSGGSLVGRRRAPRSRQRDHLLKLAVALDIAAVCRRSSTAPTVGLMIAPASGGGLAARQLLQRLRRDGDLAKSDLPQ